LGSCNPIPDTVVINFPNAAVFFDNQQSNADLLHWEAEMLLAWKELVLAFDPDIITGYNIKNFDLPYLINRSRRIENSKLVEFTYTLHE